jgi:hypothetical protein
MHFKEVQNKYMQEGLKSSIWQSVKPLIKNMDELAKRLDVKEIIFAYIIVP